MAQFSKVAADCLKHLGVYKDYSPHTISQYDTGYRQFGHYLNGLGLMDDLRNFTAERIEGFAHWLLEQGVRTNTVRHRLTGLSSLATFALKAKGPGGRPLLATDPTAHIEWPEYMRPATRFLHRDELLAFLAVETTFPEAMARELFVDTGLRVSELVRANVEHLIEGPGGAVSLAVTVKGRGRRVELVHTPVSAQVVELLKSWLLHRNMPAGGEPLLVNSLGVRWSRTGLTEMIRRLGERAGITRLPVRPHILRHTANVIARSAGLDPFVRSRLLHHRSPLSLERYEHLLPDELHQARERTVEGLVRYLGQPRPTMSRDYDATPDGRAPTLRKGEDEA